MNCCAVKRLKKLSMFLFICCLLLNGCSAKHELYYDTSLAVAPKIIANAYELEEFFSSTESKAELAANIDLKGRMLKLFSSRTPLELNGGGYTLYGSAPCLIRLDEGSFITLTNINIEADETGIGMLGSGSLMCTGVVIKGKAHAIQAAGEVKVLENSDLVLESEEGSGLTALGLEVMQNARLNSKAALAALSLGRDGLTLYKNAEVLCSAEGYNAVKTDGALVLGEGALFHAENTGEHNAAKVDSIKASAGARIEAKGGENGAGLFIMAQHEDIMLKGYCTPELRVETGRGTVVFKEK